MTGTLLVEKGPLLVLMSHPRHLALGKAGTGLAPVPELPLLLVLLVTYGLFGVMHLIRKCREKLCSKGVPELIILMKLVVKEGLELKTTTNDPHLVDQGILMSTHLGMYREVLDGAASKAAGASAMGAKWKGLMGRTQA